jgi:hypothetical protein
LKRPFIEFSGESPVKYSKRRDAIRIMPNRMEMDEVEI